ncbi:MAG: UDP-2,3-diacylglucosamine diphosphatase LpxI [Sedimentisphaerales bacterium]|nr:UDP-2,3-diacylglucosamine diphosphatase LpxI [Sedimentisphaerales bacterium]
MSSENVIGLIAGGGRLPFMIAEGIRKTGLKLICVGLAGSVDSTIARETDVYYKAAVARPGSWIRRMKRHGVTNAVMAGRVEKGQIFTPFRILRYLPDWRAVRIWYWRLRKKNKQNETLLSALADELASGGIMLEDSTKYCKEHLATQGPMTVGNPGGTIEKDIEFGWPILKKITEMDIGQAIAVKEREVLAVEAIEGTAAMIERTGLLVKSGGWTLLKAAKHKQDMRFDVPCVGPDTIRALAKNGAKCLVVEKEKTIIIDKPETIKLANESGIAIIGR